MTITTREEAIAQAHAAGPLLAEAAHWINENPGSPMEERQSRRLNGALYELASRYETLMGQPDGWFGGGDGTDK